jgi:hypothetical protein
MAIIFRYIQVSDLEDLILAMTSAPDTTCFSDCPVPRGAADADGTALPLICPLVQHGVEGLRCPACGALVSHKSHPRSITDRVVHWIGGQVRRCDACTTRFVRFASSTVLSQDLGKAHQRVVALILKLILFFAAIFGGMVFAAWVWSRIP